MLVLLLFARNGLYVTLASTYGYTHVTSDAAAEPRTYWTANIASHLTTYSGPDPPTNCYPNAAANGTADAPTKPLTHTPAKSTTNPATDGSPNASAHGGPDTSAHGPANTSSVASTDPPAQCTTNPATDGGAHTPTVRGPDASAVAPTIPPAEPLTHPPAKSTAHPATDGGAHTPTVRAPDASAVGPANPAAVASPDPPAKSTTNPAADGGAHASAHGGADAAAQPGPYPPADGPAHAAAHGSPDSVTDSRPDVRPDAVHVRPHRAAVWHEPQRHQREQGKLRGLPVRRGHLPPHHFAGDPLRRHHVFGVHELRHLPPALRLVPRPQPQQPERGRVHHPEPAGHWDSRSAPGQRAARGPILLQLPLLRRPDARHLLARGGGCRARPWRPSHPFASRLDGGGELLRWH